MPNVLRNAAESTVHALSDLVDEARDRIEDLPPLSRARQRTNNRRLTMVLIVGVLGLFALVVVKRRRRHDAGEDSTAGGRLAEKTLAVS